MMNSHVIAYTYSCMLEAVRADDAVLIARAKEAWQIESRIDAGVWSCLAAEEPVSTLSEGMYEAIRLFTDFFEDMAGQKFCDGEDEYYEDRDGSSEHDWCDYFIALTYDLDESVESGRLQLGGGK